MKYYIFRVPYEQGTQAYRALLQQALNQLPDMTSYIDPHNHFDKVPKHLKRWKPEYIDNKGEKHIDFKPFPYGGAVVAVDHENECAGISVCSMSDLFNLEYGQGLAVERMRKVYLYDQLLYACPGAVIRSYMQVCDNIITSYDDVEVPF